MKNKILKFLLIVLVFIPKTVFAAEEQNNPLGFTVTPETSENQIDTEIPYFYLKTEPGKAQKVKVMVKNTSEDTVKIKSYVANAITSEGGKIAYVPDIEKDSTLENSIEDITSIEPAEFELKKGEEKNVEITFNMPPDSYDGIKLGAVYFVHDLGDNSEGGVVKSNFSYHIAIMLSESDDSTNNAKNFNLLNVKPELLRSRKTILLNLQNPDPKMIADLSMDIKIINKKNNKVVKSQKLEEGSVAPNSNFEYAVDWGIDVVPAGTYIAKVEANSNTESWSLEKEFEITEEQAKKMNDETLIKLTLPNWVYILTVILAVLTILLTIYLVVRYNKWSSKQKKNSKNKKNKKNKRR